MPELFPHQLNAVEKMHDGCVLCGGVGTGKTITSLYYYLMAHHKKDLYVITTAKKRDSLEWEKDASLWGIGKEEDATFAGRMVIDSWNNVGKYTEIENAFFIFDEQRVVGSGAWVKAFLEITKKNPWVLLSATPGDTWMDYIPVFIANGFYRNRTEFIREHVIYNSFTKFRKVDRYVNVGKLKRIRDRVLVFMPYKKHTTRELTVVPVEYDVDGYKNVFKTRFNPYTGRPIKNASELLQVVRRVINSHPSRLEYVREALRKSRRVIVFYNYTYELEMLRTIEGVPIAEWSGQKHQDIPEGDDWLYLVQYLAGAEGWSCIKTNRTVFYSLTYSYRVFEQAQGRTDRLNTPYEMIYIDVLKAAAPLENSIWKTLKEKQNFQPSSFLPNY